MLLQKKSKRLLSQAHLDGKTFGALSSLLQPHQGFFSGILHHLLHVLDVRVRQDCDVILRVLELVVDKASLGYLWVELSKMYLF